MKVSPNVSPVSPFVSRAICFSAARLPNSRGMVPLNGGSGSQDTFSRVAIRLTLAKKGRRAYGAPSSYLHGGCSNYLIVTGTDIYSGYFLAT